MKTIKTVCLMGMILTLTSCSFMNSTNSWTVTSPDGKIAMTVELAPNGAAPEDDQTFGKRCHGEDTSGGKYLFFVELKAGDLHWP